MVCCEIVLMYDIDKKQLKGHFPYPFLIYMSEVYLCTCSNYISFLVMKCGKMKILWIPPKFPIPCHVTYLWLYSPTAFKFFFFSFKPEFIIGLQGKSSCFLMLLNFFSSFVLTWVFMWIKRPTRCHLVKYLFLLYNLLNIFRATLCPSSGADNLVVFFRCVAEPWLCRQSDPVGSATHLKNTTKSSAPEDGHKVARKMLSKL